MAVINDCVNGRHFSNQFFKNLLNQSDNSIDQVMNELNMKIFNQFQVSINETDIGSSISRLTDLSTLLNSSEISKHIELMIENLSKIELNFGQISSDPSSLPSDTVNTTVQRVRETKRKSRSQRSMNGDCFLVHQLLQPNPAIYSRCMSFTINRPLQSG